MESAGSFNELRVATYPTPNPRVLRIILYVDGRDLRDLLADTGRPTHPELGLNRPGNWAGLASYDVLLPSRHMFGEPVREHSVFEGEPEGGPVALLSCSCGITGCGALLADIEVRDGVVSWSNIRCGSGAIGWKGGYDFPGVGPFRFRENQYKQALSKADLLDHDPRPASYP